MFPKEQIETATVIIHKISSKTRFLLRPAIALICALPPLTGQHSHAQPQTAASAGDIWELRILHTSDQEAGKKALLDIAGMVAVMDQLDKLPYPNTLKLTSGDLFIAGPFMNASQVLYGNPDRYAKLKPHQRSRADRCATWS